MRSKPKAEPAPEAAPASAPEAEYDGDLISPISGGRVPRHVAIIMDGNGRWAEQRRLPRVEGHRAGIESVRSVVEASARLGIEVLTLYAFSMENWKRPRTEINTLMMLLKRYVRLELETLLKNDIRFRVIGRPEHLRADVQQEILRIRGSGAQAVLTATFPGDAGFVAEALSPDLPPSWQPPWVAEPGRWASGR